MTFFDFNFEIIPFQGFNFESSDIGLGGNIPIEIVCDEIGDSGLGVESLSLSWSETKDIKVGNKGGGAQLESNNKTIKPDARIREMLEKMASGVMFKKISGNVNWDGKQLAKNILSHQYNKIETSKHNWKPRKIYFFVDTSGSVWYLAKLIIQLIKSTNTSKTIRVFSGSESHPNKDENKNLIFCDYRKTFLDESLSDFFKIEKPEPETTFVFWGDLQMAGIRPAILKSILKPYNLIWLNPSETQYEYCESKKMSKVCKVYFGMNKTEKILKKLKKII